MTTTLRGRWKAVVATAGVIAAGFVFVAWAKMDTVQLTYRIDELIDDEARLAEEQRRLRAELAVLRTPNALAELAPELGLVVPAEGQIVVVPSELSAANSVAVDADGGRVPTHPADQAPAQ